MRARLTYTDVDGKLVSVELSGEVPVTIGRSRDNAVMLRDEHASRMHARIHFDHGQWHVRDFGLNGTKVNGIKIDQETILRHGDEVRIGDTRLRFTMLDSVTVGPNTIRLNPAEETPPSTRLPHDDLTILCNFMAAAVRETDISSLLRNTLDVLLHQTSADLAGFLSDDPNDPVTKMVAPEHSKVDASLSKQLNKRVQKEGKAVWLCCDVADTRTPESLADFSDAICLPVRSTAGRSLGTLHIYRRNRYFTERDLRFGEALVGYLANSLQLLRAQRTLAAENSRLKGRLPAAEEMVGDGPAMRELRQIIARVAPKSATVLVHGETGTGKELVAVALHQASDRKLGPMVTVNCAAIPASLMESELFGCKKGAFTGADRDREGFFQQADEGTLFLDEVAELSPECQAKLLRVLESRSFRPVGGNQDVHVNVRIVAATHRNLEEEAKAGRFRKDLLFRLSVVTIEVPPLRQHPDDLPILAQFFLEKLGTEHQREYRLTDAALAKLQSFSWPGNVRQLRATLENAAVMSTGPTLDAGIFSLNGSTAKTTDLPLNLSELEKWAVGEALKRAGGNKSRAAILLGINRQTLYDKIALYGFDVAEPAVSV